MASRRCRSGRRTARRRRRPHRGPNLRCTPATPTSHGRPPWTSRCSNFTPRAPVIALAHCCSLIDRCLARCHSQNISRREQPPPPFAKPLPDNHPRPRLTSGSWSSLKVWAARTSPLTARRVVLAPPWYRPSFRGTSSRATSRIRSPPCSEETCMRTRATF